MFILNRFNIDSYNDLMIYSLKLYISNFRKLLNNRQHKFLIKCRQNDIIPKFISKKTTKCFSTIQDKTYNNKIKNMQTKLNKDLLNIEIKINVLKLKALEENNVTLSTQIQHNLSYDDKQKFFFTLSYFQRKHNLNKTNSLQHKFINLQNKVPLPKFLIDNTCVHNLTDINIPEDVAYILSFGPKFATPVPDRKLPTLEIISEVEDVLSAYNSRSRKYEDRAHIAKIINNQIKTNKPLTYIEKFLVNAQNSTRQFIKNNKNIYVLNSDKSNKTVIMNKIEYHNKMQELLSDTNTYIPVPEDPTKKVNNKLNKQINQLFLKGLFDSNIRLKLVNYNPITPRIYGLPKLHKENTPLRPIVSTIGSSVYKLSKFLINLLKPLTNNSPYNVKNSFEFKSLLDQI